MVGVHTRCDKNDGPVGYDLVNTLVQSASGMNQAAVDEQIIRDICGISGVCGVVGGNASTQSGNKKGHAAELGSWFKTNTAFLLCYPRILNIALHNAMVGFGQRGSTLSFNLPCDGPATTQRQIFFRSENLDHVARRALHCRSDIVHQA